MKRYGRTRLVTDENVMWCMRFACWKTKAADKHSEYLIVLISTATVFKRMRFSYVVHTWSLSLLVVTVRSLNVRILKLMFYNHVHGT